MGAIQTLNKNNNLSFHIDKDRKYTKKEIDSMFEELNRLCGSGKMTSDEYYRYSQQLYFIMQQKKEVIKKKNKKQKVTEVISYEEMQQFKKKKNLISIISLLLCNTGLRVQELCDLEWKDVFDDYIVVQKGKGGKYREIPLNQDADMCLDWLSDNLKGKKYVVETGNKTKYKRQYINQMLKKINPKYHPHLFRHTFATMLRKKGVDFKIIQTLLGHSSVKTTMDIYTHPTMEEMREDIKKIKF
jgi:integrase